jgi:hypothetical protein
MAGEWQGRAGMEMMYEIDLTSYQNMEKVYFSDTGNNMNKM